MSTAKRFLVRYIDNYSDKTSETIMYAETKEAILKATKKDKKFYRVIDIIELNQD